MNFLVPQDRNIIIAQKRNQNQSYFGSITHGQPSTEFAAIAVAIASCHAAAPSAGVPQPVPTRHAPHSRRHGSSSVPDGTTVSCAAACGRSGWAGAGGVRQSLLRIVRV